MLGNVLVLMIVWLGVSVDETAIQRTVALRYGSLSELTFIALCAYQRRTCLRRRRCCQCHRRRYCETRIIPFR